MVIGAAKHLPYQVKGEYVRGGCDWDSGSRGVTFGIGRRERVRGSFRFSNTSHARFAPSPARLSTACAKAALGDHPTLRSSRQEPLRFPPSVPLLDHVGCHVSCSMRPRICQKRSLVKQLSASWSTIPRTTASPAPGSPRLRRYGRTPS